jgi:hypothetical protein
VLAWASRHAAFFVAFSITERKVMACTLSCLGDSKNEAINILGILDKESKEYIRADVKHYCHYPT